MECSPVNEASITASFTPPERGLAVIARDSAFGPADLTVAAVACPVIWRLAEMSLIGTVHVVVLLEIRALSPDGADNTQDGVGRRLKRC